MQPDLYNQQKQIASAFWKSYFAKFRRPVEDHEASETLPAPLFAHDDEPLQRNPGQHALPRPAAARARTASSLLR